MPEYAWHFHHDRLVERVYGDFEAAMAARAEGIRLHKPPDEQATRLRLLRPVVGDLPLEVVAVGDALIAARVGWDAAWAKWDAAWARWNAAGATLRRAAWAELDAAGAQLDAAGATLRAARAKGQAATSLPAVLALHAAQCPDCPWDGRTIFPTTTEVT